MDSSLDLGAIQLSDKEITMLEALMAYMHEWNHTIRLTGYSTIEAIRRNLVLESILAFFSVIPDSPSKEHFDFGSGNGTPGLIFSILDPIRRYTLIERISKKRIFMEYVIRHLGLENVQVAPAFSADIHAPTVWMKAITIADFFEDPQVQRFIRPPVHFFRFGQDPHISCIPIRTCVINGMVQQWGESHSLVLSEAVFKG